MFPEEQDLAGAARRVAENLAMLVEQLRRGAK